MVCMKWTAGSDQNMSNSYRNGGAASWCARWRILRQGGFRNHFAAAKWVYGAAKWHLCAKGWFRSCETPFQMASRLQNGGSSRRGGFAAISQLRNGCTWLRNGTRVPRDLFTAAKIFAEGARRLRNHFAAGSDFRSGSLLAAKFRRPCSLLAFELLLIHNFLISLLLTFLLILIIQKPILYQNKLKLKHWNQN